MAWFAGALIIGCAGVIGLMAKIMELMDDMAGMVSPDWINYLADRSRKRKAPGKRRACRYVQAGWRPDPHRIDRR